MNKTIKTLEADREKRGLTLDEYAVFIGIGCVTYFKWRKGYTMPSVAKLMTVSERTGIALGELIEGLSES